MKIKSYSSLRIANGFLKVSPKYKCKDLTTLKMLKMAYIAHGQALRLYNRPLFYDAVEAWKYGPVIPTLYFNIKGQYEEVVKCVRVRGVDMSNIDLDEPLEPWAEHIVDDTMHQLHNIEALALSGVTHLEGSPWSQVGCGVIPDPITKAYYEEHRVDGRPFGYDPKIGRVDAQYREYDKTHLFDGTERKPIEAYVIKKEENG
jgi:uncharacterized phage-associated protein